MSPPGGPPGIAGIGSSFSLIRASVVRIIQATETAFSTAARVPLAGSTLPMVSMSPYSPLWASNPKFFSLLSETFARITAPS